MLRSLVARTALASTVVATVACSASLEADPTRGSETTGRASDAMVIAAANTTAARIGASDTARRDRERREEEERSSWAREREASEERDDTRLGASPAVTRETPEEAARRKAEYDREMADLDARVRSSLSYRNARCCDGSAGRNVDADRFFAAPNDCGTFDYDCDGQEAREFGVARPERSGAFGCGTDGFVSPTACGEANTFMAYKWKLGCREERFEATQACR